MYKVGDYLYEAYGTDDFGRTGKYRIKDKQELLRYVDRLNNKKNKAPEDFLIGFKVVEVIDVRNKKLDVNQLSIFDLLDDIKGGE